MISGRTFCSIVAVGLVLAGHSAHAAIIDFNGLPGPDDADFTTYSENNFTVTAVPGETDQFLSLGNPAPSIGFYGGGAIGTIVITQSTTGYFTLTSVDVDMDVGGSYTITGTLRGVTVLSQTASISGFQTINIPPSSVVMDTLTITMHPSTISGGAYVDNINVTTVFPPSISCSPFPTGDEGVAYGPVACSASGAPGDGYEYSASGLPNGLTISFPTGTVSGTPIAGSRGTYNKVTISVLESNGIPNSLLIAPLTINFLANPVCPIIAGEELIPYGPVACSVASGSPPYSWSAVPLPRGLTINPSTGAIAGTPAAGTHQTYAVGVTVMDSAGGSGFSYPPSLVIYPPPAPVCPSPPNGQVGVAYGPVTCTVTGGSGGVTWSASGLPAGLSINPSTGAISGTPAAGSQATYSNVQVTVKDSLGGTATVKPPALVILSGPVITSLSPSTAAAGSGDFPLTVNGTGFANGATVQWNGTALATTFVSATQLTAAVPATLISSAGTATVTVTVGAAVTPGAPFTVNPPGQPCTFILAPLSATFAAAGGSGSITVTASRSDCTWSGTTAASFITFSNNNLTGSGTLNYSVAANPAGTSRTGTISIGAQSFGVTQGGVTCTYSLPVSSQSFPASGGAGSAAVQAPPGCLWTATSASPFIAITAPAGGSGNGSVNFTVAANPTLAGRSDTFTLANLPYAVSEAGTGASLTCTASVPTVPQVSLEGRTEVLGDYWVNCSGLAATLTADLTLTLNTNVTVDATLTVNGGSVNGGVTESGNVIGYNSIQWPGVTIAPGSGGTAVLHISGLRADASLLATVGNLQPEAITGQLSVNAVIPVPIASAQQTMANAVQSLAFTKSQASPPAGAARTLIPLQFQETSAALFQASVTRLHITLTNIPGTVQVFAPVFPKEGTAEAQLYSADANGAGGSPVAGSPQPEGAYQQLTVTQGTATATWVVLTANPPTTWTFPLLALNAATGDLNQIQVAGSLAPVSDVSIVSETAPVPRYRDFSVPQKLVNLRMSISLNASPVTKAPGTKAPVSVGSNVTFTQQLVNDTSDPTQAATGVVIRDNLPTGLTLVSCTAMGGAACNATGNQTQVNYPSLGAGQSESVVVTASVNPAVPDGTVIQNVVSGSSDQASENPSAATASISFIVNDVPVTVGITPASGATSSQSFQVQFSDPSGYQNLGVVDILINNALDGRSACYLAYVVSSNNLVLVDDGGDAGGPYAGSVVLGSSATIRNSQCAVNLVSAVGSGTTLTLTLAIAFQPVFAGDRIVFVAALSQSLANSDWQPLGFWQVPGPPPAAGTIAVTGASPTRWTAAAGTNKQFTFTLTDSAGTGDFGVVNVLINKFIDGRQACYLAYVAASNALYLVDDSGNAGGPYAGSMLLNGTSASISNGQCSVSGAGSVVSPGPNTLALTLNLTLTPAFTGNKVIYVAGRDQSGGNSTGWQAAATWSVQQPGSVQ